MRLHIGFFGITRSLRYTRGSIEAAVLAPARAQLPCRLYGHFHVPAVIDNARSGEVCVPVDPDEARLLPLDRCCVEPQDEALIARDYAAACNQADLMQDGYASLRNLCFQLRSLACLWRLMASDVAAEDWVLFLRPDLYVLDVLDVIGTVAALQRRGVALAVPEWHGWGGLNDRVALAGRDAAQAYATRRRMLRAALARGRGLHAESLLALAVARAGLRVGVLPVRAVRVRANGRAEPRDVAAFGLPARWQPAWPELFSGKHIIPLG